MIKILINEVTPCPVFRSIIVDTISKLHDNSNFIVGVGNGDIPDSDYKSFAPSLVIHNGPSKSGITQLIFKEEDKSVMPYVPFISDDLSDSRYKCDATFICAGNEPQDMIVKIFSLLNGKSFKCFGVNPSISENYCGNQFNELKLLANAKSIILPNINVQAMLLASYLGCKPYVFDANTINSFVSDIDGYNPTYPIPSKEEIKNKHTNFDRAAEFLKKYAATGLAKEVLARKNK